jgi:hypothetical protein
MKYLLLLVFLLKVQTEITLIIEKVLKFNRYDKN